VLGDSITIANDVTSFSYPLLTGMEGTLAYSSLLGEILNAEVGVKGYGSTGFSVPPSSGTGNVPALINSWSQYDNSNAMDTSIVPDYVMEMDGTNDLGSITEGLVAAVLAAIRAVWSTAWIFSINPPGVTTAAAAKSAAVAAAGDAKIIYLNPVGTLSNLAQLGTPSWVSFDGLHPNYRTQAVIAGSIGQGVLTSVNTYPTVTASGTVGNVTVDWEALPGTFSSYNVAKAASSAGPFVVIANVSTSTLTYNDTTATGTEFYTVQGVP
jgi:hypothetical protein